MAPPQHCQGSSENSADMRGGFVVLQSMHHNSFSIPVSLGGTQAATLT